MIYDGISSHLHSKSIPDKLNEKIDGSCLSIFQVNDLHQFGIINFKDKKQIYQSVQELVGYGQ